MKVNKFAMKITTGALAIFITLGLVGFTTTLQEVNSQNVTGMEDRGRGDYGNKTYGPEKSINGTINLDETIFQAIGAKINTTLSDAITTAEQAVGNNSFAMSAFGGPYGSYLVYTIIVGTPGMEFHKVIIDPGTGKVLDSQVLSHEEWMKMQQMHHMMDSGGPHGKEMGMGFVECGKKMKSDHEWK